MSKDADKSDIYFKRAKRWGEIALYSFLIFVASLCGFLLIPAAMLLVPAAIALVVALISFSIANYNFDKSAEDIPLFPWWGWF